MSKKNPEYDFAWCPGCGDFGVRRALEFALRDWMNETRRRPEDTVVVAGIGCSGNMVHMLEGPQPFGFHGIHGRTLPIAFGVKMARPDLNVVVVAGDGDFLSIGAEHIGPQAQRNLNVTAVIMDNGVYGLTKGQSSPTTETGSITSTTPFGKLEVPMRPLEMYLTWGVSFVASCYSSRVKDLARLIMEGMKHPGFAVVHVQSPCTTYNDTHDILKGDIKKGLAPKIWDIPPDHDAASLEAAYEVARSPGIPMGIIYRNPKSASLDQRVAELALKAKPKSVQELVDSYLV
ncbi:MAG: 2-oxoacid:ferredoxin oxidoreductase subunit beta [Chloroflexi bacterium]|nr:2-oxoacid:ferredoxin oxidoreductase subunit beta [Chloroflexota bacterium]